MNHETNKPDILEQAVEALRDEPVPPMTESARQRLVAIGEGDSYRAAPRRSWSGLAMKAAAAVILLVGVSALLFALFAPGPGEAWAEVRRQITGARTVSFTLTTTGLAPDTVSRMMYSHPGRLRQELIEPSAATNIMDFREGVILSLYPDHKIAERIELQGLTAQEKRVFMQFDVFAELRELLSRPRMRELGDRVHALETLTIQGRLANGFEVRAEGLDVTLWADSKTGELLRADIRLLQDKLNMTLSNFAFNVPLDESMFSTEAPPDYTLRTERLRFSEPTPEDVVALLRLWAEYRNGVFPEGVTLTHISRDLSAVREELSHRPDAKDIATRLIRGVQILHRPGARYLGRGAVLGEDKPVFAYRNEDGSYTVIYADMRIETDVAQKDLPFDPAETTPPGD